VSRPPIRTCMGWRPRVSPREAASRRTRWGHRKAQIDAQSSRATVSGKSVDNLSNGEMPLSQHALEGYAQIAF
jgi:hypothetical protein